MSRLISKKLETMKNYYTAPREYILNPFQFIYQDNDVHLSENPAITDTLQNIIDIDKERLDLDLPFLESQIRLNSLSYVHQGCIFATIKFKKLYKHQYSKFEEFCKYVLGKSQDSVDNAIKAARVCLELIMNGFEYEDLPNNMSQAVQLKEFSGNELIEKWNEVLANLERHQRTAKNIKQLLYPPVVNEESVNTTVKLPLLTYNKLIEVAYHAKLSISQAIEAVVQILTNEFQKSDISRFLRWQLDLMDLTSFSG